MFLVLTKRKAGSGDEIVTDLDSLHGWVQLHVGYSLQTE